MDKLKTISTAFLGVFFLLLSIVAFATEGVLAGLSLLAVSIIVMPYTARVINSKASDKLTVPVRVIASVVLLILFGSLVEKNEPQVEVESSPILLTDNALKWQSSTDERRITVCKQIIERSWKSGMFSDKASDYIYKDMITYSNYLCEQINIAFAQNDDETLNKRMFTNQKVGDTAVMIMTIEGWLK